MTIYTNARGDMVEKEGGFTKADETLLQKHHETYDSLDSLDDFLRDTNSYDERPIWRDALTTALLYYRRQIVILGERRGRAQDEHK